MVAALNDVIDVVREREITRFDRIIEHLRIGGYLEAASARGGLTLNTVNRWLRDGARLAQALLDGQRENADLTVEERDLVRFAHAVYEAEAQGEHALLTQAHRFVIGGLERQIITRKVIPAREGGVAPDGTLIEERPEITLEETTRTETTLPDPAMIRWRLERRYPNRWASTQRVELSGREGGPIQVEDRSAVDVLLGELDQMAERAAEVARVRQAFDQQAIEAEGHETPT